MRIDPRPMVLARVHLGSGVPVPPQLVMVTVNGSTATPPVASVGEIVAVNCLMACLAPLTLGAATRAAIRSKALATKTSLPRLESNGLSADMSCPFFLAGHKTRMILLPRALAWDPRTDVTSTRSPLNRGQGRVGQMADIVNVLCSSFDLHAPVYGQIGGELGQMASRQAALQDREVSLDLVRAHVR